MTKREKFFKSIAVNGLALKDVPEKYRTFDLCLDAVRQNGLAIQYVPVLVMNHDLCLEAVTQCPEAIRYVPEEFHSEHICLIVADRESTLFGHLKPKTFTPRLAKLIALNIAFRDLTGEKEQ